MSDALVHLLWLLLVLGWAVGFYGAVLLARGWTGGGSRVARRFARVRPAVEPVAEPRGEPLFRWVDGKLPGLARRLAVARAPFTPSQVVMAQLAIGFGLLLALDVAGIAPLLALAMAALIGVLAPLAAIGGLAARRRRKFTAQLPQAIDLMARGLQAGHPLVAAMAVASRQMPEPLGPELGVVIAEIGVGLDRDEALRSLVRRFPSAELRMFVACLEVTRETGGNIAEVLLGLADRLRQQKQLKKKIEALSAEGRLSFWVIAALPVLSGGAILAMRPQYYTAVAGDPLFWPLMAEPPVLMLIGGLVIWRMINVRI